MKMRITGCAVCVFLALVALGAAPVYADDVPTTTCRRRTEKRCPWRKPSP